MKKLFRILFTLIMVSVSTIGLAGGPEEEAPLPEPNYFDGFYVGIEGSFWEAISSVDGSGRIICKTNHLGEGCSDRAIRNPNQDLHLDVVTNGEAGGLAGAGGAQLGFGKVFHGDLFDFYLGLNVFGEIGKTDQTSFATVLTDIPDSVIDIPGFMFEHETMSVRVRLKNELGIVFKPGIILAPQTLAFFKVGPVWSQLEVLATFDIGGVSTLLQKSVSQDIRKGGENVQTGALVGVGLEQFLTDNITVSGEYNFMVYGTTKTDSSDLLDITDLVRSIDPIHDPDNVFIKDNPARANMAVSLFKLGFNYYFSL